MWKAYSLFLRPRMMPLFMVFLLAPGIVKCQGPKVDATQWFVSLQGKDSNDCHTQITPCRLIATALQRATSGDTIRIAAGVFKENLGVDKEITMIGAGPDQTIIDAGLADTVLKVNGYKYPNGMDFSLSEVSLFHGQSQDGAGLWVSHGNNITLQHVIIAQNIASGQGGGIYDDYARRMALDQVTVWHNSAGKEGGGIYFSSATQGNVDFGLDIEMDITNSDIQENSGSEGGGIYNEGKLTLENTKLEGNHARGSGMKAGEGGGLFNDHEATISNCSFKKNTADTGGGGISSLEPWSDTSAMTTASIIDSTISDNQANSGGGIDDTGELSLTNSTVANNQATLYGGGINDSIYSTVPPYHFYATNSTISGNSAMSGGGFWLEDMTDNLTGTNLTIAYNQGPGIYAHLTKLTLINSLLAANGGGNCDFAAVTGTDTTDLSDDSSCSGFIEADPMIGPLADNGGPTMTHKLMPGSPAIDAGSDVPLTKDQRGVKRPLDGDGDGVAKIDIGAYEYDQAPLALPPTRSILVTTPTAPAVITFTPRNLNPYCLRGPDPAFSPIGVAMQGQAYPVKGRSEGGKWLFIHLSEKVDCWVPLSTGTASGDLSLVAALASPPTPAKAPQPPACVKSPTHPCP